MQYNLVLFKNAKDRMDFAQQFLDERITSLESDVRKCIENTCPFPALLYCFSTIDLLGSLYEGDATGDTRSYGERVRTTRKAKKYMTEIMGYPEYETNILQNQFRHKIVHLAQPQTLIYDNKNNILIGWKLDNKYYGKHMTVERLSSKQPVVTLIPFKMEADAVFVVSIDRLLEDIIKSVKKSSCSYLEKLKRDHNSLHQKFDDAINQIYSAKK